MQNERKKPRNKEKQDEIDTENNLQRVEKTKDTDEYRSINHFAFVFLFIDTHGCCCCCCFFELSLRTDTHRY
jgi:hypothetical protein